MAIFSVTLGIVSGPGYRKETLYSGTLLSHVRCSDCTILHCDGLHTILVSVRALTALYCGDRSDFSNAIGV